MTDSLCHRNKHNIVKQLRSNKNFLKLPLLIATKVIFLLVPKSTLLPGRILYHSYKLNEKIT